MAKDADSLAKRYGPWALVAGASEGIGASFCRRLAAVGVHLVLVARRAEVLAALAGELRDRYRIETREVALDLSTPEAATTLFAATEGLDIGLLVYNAGADPYGKNFLAQPVSVWAGMLHRNCTVPLQTCHHYAQPMVRRGRGGIILVSSGGAWAGGARLATYNATKAFDLVFGESLWAELRMHGVDVLSLICGPTDTPAIHRLAEAHGTSLGELADPDDVACAGLENLGNGPTWTMGQADGGGPFPLGTMPRREAVMAISAGAAAMLGPVD